MLAAGGGFAAEAETDRDCQEEVSEFERSSGEGNSQMFVMSG